MDEGAAVVDVRPGRDYDREDLPGSYSIGIDGPVSAWVGWLIARGRLIVLAGGTDAQHPKAPRPLLPIGFATTPGALDWGMGALRAGCPGGVGSASGCNSGVAQWVVT